MIGSMRISKAEFYQNGGFANIHHWRRQQGCGAWQHYYLF